MVRGFTLSPSNVDRHYCVGTIAGRDVILLERTDTISFPDRPSRGYTWLIIQFDLKQTVPIHALLNSCKYDEIIYTMLRTKLSHLHKHGSHLLGMYDPGFAARFQVYAPLHKSDLLPAVVSLATANELAERFAGVDFELFDDELLVYIPTTHPNKSQIDLAIRAGLWFTEQIEAALFAYYASDKA